MVVVPRIGDAAVQPPSGPGAGGGPKALLNINTASLQELDGPA